MSGVPVDEVERLLAKQREMYEARLRELQQQNTSNRPAAAEAGPSSTAAPIPSNNRRLIMTNIYTPITTCLNQGPHRGSPSARRQETQHSPVAPFQIPRSPYPYIYSLTSSTRSGSSLPAPAALPRGLANLSISPNTVTNAVNAATAPNNITPTRKARTKSATRRDKSASRLRPKARSNDDDEFNCPTCKNKYGVYIFQCSVGHSSCRDCKIKGTKCGVCNNTITDMRNYTMENYISERHVSCPNASEGCCLTFKVSEMEDHLKECPFNDIQCPVAATCGNCTWQGKISKISSHFDEKHPEHRQGAVDTEMLIPDIHTDSTTMHLVELGPYNFLVYIKVDKKESQLYITVQLCGTPISASKWTYEIHLYTKCHGRRYEYTDICLPNCIPVGNIFKESKCMSIPLIFATNFDEDGCLTYKFFVTKTFKRTKGRGHLGKTDTSSEGNKGA